MPGIHFKITEEKVALNHSIEKEKTRRRIGCFSSSYSVQNITFGVGSVCCWWSCVRDSLSSKSSAI